MTRLADLSKSEEQIKARADHVDGLLQHYGWIHLKAEIEARIEKHTDKILAGDLDAVGYREYCARRRELVWLLELPLQLIGQAQEGPDSE